MAVSVVAGELRAFVDRLTRLAEDKAEIAAAEKEVMAEAKGQGYDPKVIRRVLAELRLDADARAERRAMLDLYLGALGELADTPLGAAAAEAARDGARMAEVDAALARLRADGCTVTIGAAEADAGSLAALVKRAAGAAHG
jgi:uncharacterized protein (UPF0335 family)